MAQLDQCPNRLSSAGPLEEGDYKEGSSADKLGLGSLRNVPYPAGSRLAVSCRQLLESKCADWSAGYQ